MYIVRYTKATNVEVYTYVFRYTIIICIQIYKQSNVEVYIFRYTNTTSVEVYIFRYTNIPV